MNTAAASHAAAPAGSRSDGLSQRTREKARRLHAAGNVRALDAQPYAVQGDTAVHIVLLRERGAVDLCSCACRGLCSHIAAARLTAEAQS